MDRVCVCFAEECIIGEKRACEVERSNFLFASQPQHLQDLESMTQSDLITLPPCSEYRFELEPNERFSIKLISGQAEIFGAELVCEKWYGFQDEAKGALSTWNGAQIEMSIQESWACAVFNRTGV